MYTCTQPEYISQAQFPAGRRPREHGESAGIKRLLRTQRFSRVCAGGALHLALVLARLVVHVEAREEALRDGLIRDLEDRRDERLRRHYRREERHDEHRPEQAGTARQRPPERAVVRLRVHTRRHADNVRACPEAQSNSRAVTSLQGGTQSAHWRMSCSSARIRLKVVTPLQRTALDRRLCACMSGSR